MTTLRKITWGVTILFLLLFIVRWGIAFTIETSVGSLGFATPYILGIFLGNALIPSILWVVVYFKEIKK